MNKEKIRGFGTKLKKKHKLLSIQLNIISCHLYLTYIVVKRKR